MSAGRTEKIEDRKSVPTNPNMTYLGCSRAEIIASEVGSFKKRKKSHFFDFHRQERVKYIEFKARRARLSQSRKGAAFKISAAFLMTD